MSTANPDASREAPAATTSATATPATGRARTTREATLTVLHRFYEAEAAYISAGGVGAASFDELAACLDPDVVMYQAPGLPYGGTWRGPEGIERFMAAMSMAWRSLEFFEQRFVVDEDAVVVFNRGRLTARATGRQLDTAVMQLITVAGGRISEMRPFYFDTLAVAEALHEV